MKNWKDRSLYSKEEIEKAILNSKNMTQVCHNLDLIVGGGNYEFITKKIKEYNIDTSHFLSRKEYFSTIIKKGTIDIDDVIYNRIEHNLSTVVIKRKLYKAGLKERKCEECGLGEDWNGKKLVHHLDHINGNKKDWRLENLKILCPNCHSITETYCRRKDKKNKIQPNEIKEKNKLNFIKFINIIQEENLEDIDLWKKIKIKTNYTEQYSRKLANKFFNLEP